MMTPEQRQWLDNWLAGLRDGTLSSAAGFINKLGSLGVSQEDRATLTDLYMQHGVQALCNVVEAFLINSVPLQEAIDQELGNA